MTMTRFAAPGGPLAHAVPCDVPLGGDPRLADVAREPKAIRPCADARASGSLVPLLGKTAPPKLLA